MVIPVLPPRTVVYTTAEPAALTSVTNPLLEDCGELMMSWPDRPPVTYAFPEWSTAIPVARQPSNAAC